MSSYYSPGVYRDKVLPYGYVAPSAASVQQLLTLTHAPFAGNGILAGSFPEGLTTIEGDPTPATVRVLFRPASGAPGDGTVVAEVQSGQDGTWLVEGLNPNLKYDVVGRKDGFNDVIMANVSPEVE